MGCVFSSLALARTAEFKGGLRKKGRGRSRKPAARWCTHESGARGAQGAFFFLARGAPLGCATFFAATVLFTPLYFFLSFFDSTLRSRVP